MLGFSDVPAEEDAGRTARPLLDRRFGGLDCGEVSEMMQYSHASTLNDIRKKRRSDPSWVPTAIATMPQLRMTRRIQGEYTLDEGEMHKYFADSVGMVSDWRKRGLIYEVPFFHAVFRQGEESDHGGAVYLRDGRQWDIMRVIPCCAVTGQAAGTAAALTEDFSAMDIRQLQQTLKNSGVILHERELNIGKL